MSDGEPGTRLTCVECETNVRPVAELDDGAGMGVFNISVGCDCFTLEGSGGVPGKWVGDA